MSVDLETFVSRVITNVEKVIIGKREQIELLLAAMLCQGHILLEDVPGTGKTMLAHSMAISLGVDFKRLQCTPDLLPTDITGVPSARRALRVPAGTNIYPYTPGRRD